MYPNMELEFEVSPESAPLLMFTPGNVTFMPVMNAWLFVLLPNSSEREPVCQFRVSTNISATITINAYRVFGSVSTVR
ncbi:lipopolysaccharide-binding protein-like [Erinaceus europaeus]|uniref:Bactericidal permeability-increasing protein n=1 Tax=Erinaceus europaeus TaxID=9365 RepID=A0A1S3WA94_ERIEU|nr:lipopolysaccharide-binding protein-like [Erinaceus europaeus]